MGAKLYFRVGTMGSSKSTFLLTTAHSFAERNIPFICIKPDIDDRDDSYGLIKSKIGISRECAMISRDTNIYNWFSQLLFEWNSANVGSAEWIFVDEVQFMSAEQIEQLAQIVDEFNVNVMCYGLRTDFQTHIFEGSKRLFELADDIEEIKISCKCGKKAIVNARLNEFGDVVTSGEQVMLGGDDVYIPLCRSCYHKAIKNEK